MPKATLCTAAMLLAGLVGCDQSLSGKSDRPTYVVKLSGDRIEFGGIDQPSVVKDRANDRWEVNSKIGRYNVSKEERCQTEAEKALGELETLAAQVDTQVLINSLRGTRGDSFGTFNLSPGGIDYYVARDGNMVLLEDIYKRRPLRQEQYRELKSIQPFLGSGGPAFFSAASAIGLFFAQKLPPTTAPDSPSPP